MHMVGLFSPRQVVEFYLQPTLRTALPIYLLCSSYIQMHLEQIYKKNGMFRHNKRLLLYYNT